MNKFYNNQDSIARGFSNFLKFSIPNLRKTQLNIIPFILFGMISSESCVPSDIAKSLKDDFSLIQFDSVVKRINRFFNNDLFDPYSFFHNLISFVISSYKTKHSDKRVHIIFDHMLSHENYTILMFSMRIGKQGIPIWFKCFKGVSDNDAFKIDTIKQGIIEVSNLFKDTDFELIFLADRWFNSISILDTINSLGHTYCIRLKKNIIAWHYDKKEKHIMRNYIENLKGHKYHSTFYQNVELTDFRYKSNIVISNSIDTDDTWVIVTNGDCKKAIKDYSYRFGGVESVFKNQKSNGFNLQKISNASLKAFTTMYSMVCTCVLYLTILGTDYSKNVNCYKNIKLTTHKTYIINGKKIKKRVMSLFNTGLTLFKRAFNSLVYIRLPFSFKLYDI